MNWVVWIIEFVIDKTPILGKIKRAIERDIPMRQLSYQELISDKWLKLLCHFLNNKFKQDYDREYSPQQIKGWLDVYEDAFLVIVQRKFISWPLNEEHIVATVKIFPLRKDYCVCGVFESYDVTPSQLVRDECKAKAIWVGDLVSTSNNLLVLFMALGFKLENLGVPVYCRTVIRQLRSILMERYGARIINPTGAEATAASILVLEPSCLRHQKPSHRGKDISAQQPLREGRSAEKPAPRPSS